MDFVIVYPPSDYSRAYRPSLPLGGLYLADALANHGHDAAIVDGSVDRIMARLDGVVTRSTLALGISTMSGFQLQAAVALARHLRTRYPGKPLIWGGAHPTALPLQTLASDLVD